jgi:hypothetical protein
MARILTIVGAIMAVCGWAGLFYITEDDLPKTAFAYSSSSH